MPVTHVGFTGTRDGMSRAQRVGVRGLLEELLATARATTAGPVEFHHGDCVGADAEAQAMARLLGYHPIAHPPLVDLYRAYTTGNYQTLPPADYQTRNRAIVDATVVLVAAPGGAESDRRRSGTWATVRYARQRGRGWVLVYPDGSIEKGVA